MLLPKDADIIDLLEEKRVKIPKLPRLNERKGGAMWKRRLIAGAIMRDVADGGTVVASAPKYGIKRVTFAVWMLRYPDMAAAYEIAKEMRAEKYIEEIVPIADDATEEDVRTAELRVRTRKIYAEMAAPRKYGKQLTVSGNPDAPAFTLVIKE